MVVQWFSPSLRTRTEAQHHEEARVCATSMWMPLSTMLPHPEKRERKERESKMAPGGGVGCVDGAGVGGVGSSYPSTSTGDPTSQAGAKLEV